MPRTVKLNANRNVTGQLRGFDQFMNIVLDNTIEEVSETERNEIGLVVRRRRALQLWQCWWPVDLVRGAVALQSACLTEGWLRAQVIRGNSIVMMECLERI